MHEIPSAFDDHTIDIRREVVVALGWPGADTADANTLGLLGSRQLSARIGGEYGDVDTIAGETARYFIDMVLNPAHIREVAWGHHQHPQRISRLRYKIGRMSINHSTEGFGNIHFKR